MNINVREILIRTPVHSESYIVLRGRNEPYVSGDLMDRSGVIAEVAGDVEHLRQIIAFDLEVGTSRDATEDVCGVVISRWAEDGKILTDRQYEFVEMVKGTMFANAFRREVA